MVFVTVCVTDGPCYCDVRLSSPLLAPSLATTVLIYIHVIGVDICPYKGIGCAGNCCPSKGDISNKTLIYRLSWNRVWNGGIRWKYSNFLIPEVPFKFVSGIQGRSLNKTCRLEGQRTFSESTSYEVHLYSVFFILRDWQLLVKCLPFSQKPFPPLKLNL